MQNHFIQENSSAVTNLKQFLSWTIPLMFAFALITGGMYFFLQDILLGSLGLIIFLFGCVSWFAWNDIKRLQIKRSIIVFSIAQLLAAICVTVIYPSLLPALILVPLLTVAVALPYLHGQNIRSLIVGCWIVLISIASLGIFSYQNAGVNESFSQNMLILAMIGATSALVLLLLWQFSSRLHTALDATITARTALSENNNILAEKNSLLESKITEQDRLLELIATLEVPVIQIADSIVLAPLVGHIDSRRATSLTARLMNEVTQRKARVVIIDIAGVSLIDTTIAQRIIEMGHALRLLGCKIAICGISANVALTMMSLGVAMNDITIVRGPQEAIELYQNELRIKALNSSVSIN